MIQFYVLSLTFLLYGAAYLLADEYGMKYHLLIRVKESLVVNQTVTIVIIVLTTVIGVLKLISPVSPGPVVVGDFLPALCLLAQAVFFVFDMKKKGSMYDDEAVDLDEDHTVFADSDLISKTQNFYSKYKRYIGYSFLIVAFLQFLFPGAVLL